VSVSAKRSGEYQAAVTESTDEANTDLFMERFRLMMSLGSEFTLLNRMID
jgi:hypothetical protein